MRNFVLGASAVLVLLGLLGYIAVQMGLIPANADSAPGKLETWAARTSLKRTVTREAPALPATLSPNDENLIAGIHLYAQNCAVCHGASDSRASAIAKGLYQHAPQLAKDGVEDDPEGVIFWKIKHGIRLTGMPAFGPSFSDDQLWQVSLFLKHMDSLSPRAAQAWKAVPSSARS